MLGRETRDVKEGERDRGTFADWRNENLRTTANIFAFIYRVEYFNVAQRLVFISYRFIRCILSQNELLFILLIVIECILGLEEVIGFFK